MAGEKLDSLQAIGVKLTGNNYTYWAYVMKNFLMGKNIWSYVTGVTTKPTDSKAADYAMSLSTWEDKLALIEPEKLSSNELYCTFREEQRLVKIFMALRGDFEGLCGSILHRSPLPSVDSVVNELLAEEIRFKTTHGKGILPLPNHTVLAVPPKFQTNSQNKQRVKTAIDECASHHMTSDPSLFVSTFSLPSSTSVMDANGTSMSLVGVGSILSTNLSLPDDLHSMKLIGTGRKEGGLYVLEELHVPIVAASSIDLSSFKLNSKSSIFYLWHSRLGHVSSPHLRYLVSFGTIQLPLSTISTSLENEDPMPSRYPKQVLICELGFHSSNHDSTLFLRSTSAGYIVLLLYVDDMIIIGDDFDGISTLKSQLQQQFEMKDL
ncbi:hypothetical protein EZV62_024821 [Acer yangbiense]|uniref:GAG-pre-integrase domain-containing protein n=1 Tax=Acer yangbiense TaxID=1000413 RepID=A0A5C7GY03_9ROSI|nr:hypothetical protein EZV62_024821 [Acer yangbiense]